VGLHDERTIDAQLLTDCLTCCLMTALYLITHGLLYLFCALFLFFVTFLGPGGRRRRDRMTKLVGEKSRALLTRLGVSPDIVDEVD
jgi:hypothetical protein